MEPRPKDRWPELKAVTAPPPVRRRRFNLLALRIEATRALDKARAEPFHLLLAEQDRWFLWLPVALAGGVCVYFAVPGEPILPALAVAALSLTLAAWNVRDAPVGFAFTAACASILAGMALASWEAHRVHAPAIAMRTGPVTVLGEVLSVERRDGGAVRYRLRVSSVSGVGKSRLPQQVTITWRGEGEAVAAGSQVRARAILMPPPQAAAPGAFDFARRAYFEGLGGVGFALGAVQAVPREHPASWRFWWAAATERIRDGAAARIRVALPGSGGEVAAALIVGKRGGIPEATTQALRSAGLQHVLAISGLHMALVAGSVYAGLRMLLAALPGLALRHPIRKVAAVAALVAAAAYLVLSGASVSAQRAFIMAAVMFLAVLASRPAITLRNVAIAAVILIAMHPFAVTEAGFQMSFAATIALVSVFETLRRRRLTAGRPVHYQPGMVRRLRTGLAVVVLTALVAGLATAPYAAFHFNRIAPYGLLGNVLAMPVVSLVVMPSGVLAGLAMPFGLDSAPLWIMGKGIAAVEAISVWVSGLPAANRNLAAFPSWALVLITAGMLWGLLWRGRWRHVGGTIGLAAGLATASAGHPPDVLIDRDGGLAAIRTQAGTLAFAARRKSGFVIETWLRRSGDPREEAEALDAVQRCRSAPCRVTATTASGIALTVSVQMRGEDVGDACRGADIAVLDMTSVDQSSIPDAGCEGTLAVTRSMLEERGALAIRVRRNKGRPPEFTLSGANDGSATRIWRSP